MPLTLYTIGYERQSIDEYVHALVAAGVNVVVDVRQTAWSYKRDFAKAPLERALRRAGIEYFHADFAGNPKEIRATARTRSALPRLTRISTTRTTYSSCWTRCSTI